MTSLQTRGMSAYIVYTLRVRTVMRSLRMPSLIQAETICCISYFVRSKLWKISLRHYVLYKDKYLAQIYKVFICFIDYRSKNKNCVCTTELLYFNLTSQVGLHCVLIGTVQCGYKKDHQFLKAAAAINMSLNEIAGQCLQSICIVQNSIMFTKHSSKNSNFCSLLLHFKLNQAGFHILN